MIFLTLVVIQAIWRAGMGKSAVAGIKTLIVHVRLPFRHGYVG